MSEFSEIDPTKVPQRSPILGKEDSPKFNLDEVDKKWNQLSEAVKQQLFVDKKLRDAYTEFCTIPVSETLAEKAVSKAVEISGRVSNLARRFNSSLGEYIKLPEIPERSIPNDLREAYNMPWIDPQKEFQEIKDRWARYDLDPEKFEGFVRDDWRQLTLSGRFSSATKEEVFLVARRYRFARDVKLLALGAELINTGEKVSFDANGEVSLPSGIKIKAGSNIDEREKNDLISPLRWVKRKQVKDRVYEIQVDEKKYFLKERKTPRHTDTKRHGHIDGNTSQGEFETATLFNEKGQVFEQDLKTGWERPMGFVVYPDGYQFMIFEYEEGLLSASDAQKILTEKIVGKEDAYSEEFKEVVRKLESEKQPAQKRSLLGRINPFRKKETPLISFLDFAKVKARIMEDRARELQQDVILDQGYTNTDTDGYAYRIIDGQRPVLEIVGFDFEYYSKGDPEYIAGVKTRTSEYRAKDKEVRKAYGISRYSTWDDNGDFVTDIQNEVYKIMIAA